MPIRQKARIDWRDAIVKTLKDLGGCGTTQEIYGGVRRHVALTPDLTKRWYGSKHRYYNIVRSHLSAMKKEGILKNPKLGYYKLIKK